MSKNAILDQVFPTRSKAVLAFRAPASADDVGTLQSLAEEAKQAEAAYGRAPAARRWRAFAEAIDIIRLLIEWQNAVLTAAVDSDRFLRAARSRLKQLRQEVGSDPYAAQLIELLAVIEGEFDPGTIKDLREKLASIPLPIAIFADPEPERPEWAMRGEKQSTNRAPDLSVAFVEFKIDGTVAARVQLLRPRENHDLDIAVRVSRWPDAATSLVLSPISIEPPGSYELPTFAFERPPGDPPFFFQQRGRMILHVPQSLKARPFEFMYTAEFRPTSSEQPVSIAGQRTLRLDGSNPDHQPITGYSAIDRKLVSLRDSLRLEPLISEQDLDDLLRVLIPLANLMGQAVQDARFPKVLSESEFQKQVREFLRQHPSIGAGLEEQAHSTGGRTDLSFRGIRIELKCEAAKKLLPEDCKRYASQPASYAAGTNRRVAVLCVLDCSLKTDVPFPAEDGLFVYPVDTGTSPIYIATSLVQGNLAKPSSLSR
jgi:hypothetical protein